MIKVWCFCLLSLMLIVTPAKAEVLPDHLSLGLQKMESLQGFSCQFEQNIVFESGGYQRYLGSLSIRRPGKFRWQYVQPYEQLFVSKGKGVWHYEPDLMQAQWFESFDAVDPVAMQLLEGRIKAKDVRLLDKKSLIDDGYVYHLRIRDSLQLYLALNAAGDLLWLESKDVLGNRNRITLLQLNKDIPEQTVFNFSPPEGVDVIDAPKNILKIGGK